MQEMQEALDHFDKSLEGVENLPYIVSYPPLPSPHPKLRSTLRSSPYSSGRPSPQLTRQSTPMRSPSPSAKPGKKRGKEELQYGRGEVFYAIHFRPLSEQQIRELLLKWVSTQPSYRKQAAKEMIFRSVSSVTVYLYRLDTFIEERSIHAKFEPYGTHVLDRPVEGWRLDPWDLAASPFQMFNNEIKCVRVPHTDEVQMCPECEGKRCVPCKACFGTGTMRCLACEGTGRNWFRMSCSACQGRQLLKCTTCFGTAQLSCQSCIGQGFCCYFKELKVEFRNIMYQHIFTTLEIPRHLLAEAEGDILYEQDGRRVSPITSFPDESINKASQVFVEISKRFSGPDCQILWQKHHLKAVPVTTVCYQWRKDGKFFVYGIKNSVYCIDYPSQSTSCLPACC
ncbi:protein SSUH2 homolog [Rhinatrema bivittatum]|uniref:protein SSUH2 homolog n=1 Tax=Rhinatrema bivittatum TaxID=194408 RepID=UPI0011291DD2|nr:protein SSUH2 homolog [Rhinatrema bivittatum]